MSLLDLLKGNYERHVGNWTPITPRNSGWFREKSTVAAGISVTQDTAMNSGTAMACTRAISETLASLPATVMEQVDADERRKARENPMWSLLHDQPNPDMDSMSWYELNCNRVVNRGNAVNVIEYNGRGIPIALWPVHNSRFEIFRRRSQQVSSGRFFPGEVFYRIWPDETDRHFDVPSEEVLNIVSWDTDDGLVGRGVVARARQEIGLDIAEQEFAASMFKNGTLPLGLIKHPFLEDQEQREGLRADLNALHQGRENWNKIGVLWDKDADWVKLGYTADDVQAIQSRIFTAKALCRYYNVQPAIVQIFEDYKFATVEAMLKHFIMMTIRPYAVRFERAINTQIMTGISDFNVFLEFAMEALLRGDPEAQAKTNAIYRSWGVLNADEIRQRYLGMNPLADGTGEAYLAPLNHGPLDRVAAGENLSSVSNEDNDRNRSTDSNSTIGKPRFDKAHLAALMRRARQEGPQRPESPGNGTQEFATRVIDQMYSRTFANEINAINERASRGPRGFVRRMDEYYNRLRDSLVRDLSVGCAGLSDKPNELAEKIVDRHISKSRGELLKACECSPDDFQDSIATCLAGWRDRTWQEIGAK